MNASLVGLFPSLAVAADLLSPPHAIAAAVTLSPIVAGLLFLSIMAAIWMVRHPGDALLIAVVLIYANVPVVALRSYGLPAVAACAPVLLLSMAAFHQAVILEKRWRVVPMLLPMGVFFSVQLGGAAVAERPDESMRAVVLNAIEALVLVMLVTNAVRTVDHLRNVAVGLVATAALLSGLGAYQHVTGTFDSNYGGFAEVPEFDPNAPDYVIQQPRLAGPIGEKNYFAQFLLMILPLALVPAVASDRFNVRFASALGAGLIVTGIVLTYSRGGAAALGGLLLLMVFFHLLRPRHIVLAVALAAAALFALPEYRERISTFGSAAQVFQGDTRARQTDAAIQGRASEMVAALVTFCRHPLIGSGTEMFKYEFQREAHLLGFQVHTGPRHAHCLWLHLAAENGLAGLASYCWLGVMLFTGLTRVWRRSPDDSLRQISAALALGLASYLAAGLFLSFLYTRYFWLLSSLAAAACALDADKRLGPSQQLAGADRGPYEGAGQVLAGEIVQ